ncbi:hypothetical protein KY361_04480 [Candidatus Woesearchaeota archaeon]|nr:hypothetical protein [Candidatus Woesearchaeota archaeon]
MIKRIIIFSFVFLILLNGVGAIAVNVDTEEIKFNNVLAGGYAEKVIRITSDSDDFVLITPSAMGKIKDWVRFEPSAELSLSKAKPISLKLVIRPPDNVAEGAYTGTVLINLLNKQSEIDQGIAISQIKISVQITNQEVKQVEIKDVSIKDTEEDHLVDIFVDIANKGNVEARVKAIIGIDGIHSVHEVPLLPFEEKLAVISLSQNLTEGRYNGDITFLLDDVFLRDFRVPFSVLERYSLLRYGKLLFIETEKEAEINERVNINTHFENIGELGVHAKFKGSIHISDTPIKYIESEEVYVPVGKSVVLNSGFTPETRGMHKVVGKVFYSITATDEKESTVRVEEEVPEVVPLRASLTGPLFLILFLIILNIVLRKRLK